MVSVRQRGIYIVQISAYDAVILSWDYTSCANLREISWSTSRVIDPLDGILSSITTSELSKLHFTNVTGC